MQESELRPAAVLRKAPNFLSVAVAERERQTLPLREEFLFLKTSEHVAQTRLVGRSLPSDRGNGTFCMMGASRQCRRSSQSSSDVVLVQKGFFFSCCLLDAFGH